MNVVEFIDLDPWFNNTCALVYEIVCDVSDCMNVCTFVWNVSML